MLESPPAELLISRLDLAVIPNPGSVVRFGDYEVDMREQVLRRNGAYVAVQDKPFQILLALLERPGQLVSREELRNRLWPTDEFGAFEDGLNTAVRKLRIALNDSAETPQLIETVPRRGYRFIAPTAVVAFGGAPLVASPSEAPTPAPALTDIDPKRRSHRQTTFFMIAALVLLGAASWSVWRWLSASRAPRQQISSLAVLPLLNQTGDASQNYFVDGMTDELTTSLAQLKNLKVISETSAMHYRNTSKSLRQIAAELDVDSVVEGSVTRSGDQVRITAQLIDARNDQHLWAESYQRSANDALALQQEVARSIADQVHVTLTPAETQRLQTLPTRNGQAYDAYLRARYLLNTGLFSRKDNDECIALAEKAITLDPTFAQPYAIAAQGYSQKIFSWSGTKEDDEKAFIALDKALTLDPGLSDAYVTRGALYYNHLHGFDLVNAVASFERAASLTPKLAQPHHDLGSALTHAGLHERAIAEYRTALELDPINDNAKYRLSRALWQSKRFEECIENYDRYNIRAVEEALPLLYLGRRQQAWNLLAELAPQAGKAFRAREDFPAVRALLYASEGKPHEAEREIRDAIQLGKNDDHFHHAAFIIAAAYAEMGQPHQAVQWLHRTVDLGMPNYPLFRDNPSIAKLAGNPEFEQFMAEFKPRWEQFANNL